MQRGQARCLLALSAGCLGTFASMHFNHQKQPSHAERHLKEDTRPSACRGRCSVGRLAACLPLVLAALAPLPVHVSRLMSS